MKNKGIRKVIIGTLFSVTLLFSSLSWAGIGTVKVECMRDTCLYVTLGSACDTFMPGSIPIAIACDEVSGFGNVVPCGSGTGSCIVPRDLSRDQDVGKYCFDGGGYDATVTCQEAP